MSTPKSEFTSSAYPPQSKILPKRVYFECFLSTYLPILNYLCTPVSCWSGPRGMHSPRLRITAIAEFNKLNNFGQQILASFSKLNTLLLNNWLLEQNMTCKNWFFNASPNVHSLIWRSEKVAMDGSFLHGIDLLSFKLFFIWRFIMYSLKDGNFWNFFFNFSFWKTIICFLFYIMVSAECVRIY